MRRKRPRLFARLRGGIKAGATATVAAIAPAQYLFAAIHDTLYFYEATVAFCLGCGVVVSFVAGRLRHLPDTFVAREQDERYTCRFATRETLPLSNDMTRLHFGDEFLPSQELESWRRRNPKAFVQLINNSGEVCAGFGAVAFCKGFKEAFVAGTATDLEVRPHEIEALDACVNCSAIYIAGVVVRDPDKQIGRKRASVMVWTFLEYIRHLYGLKRTRQVYALAVTRESERLLRNLGFSVAGLASGRKDRHTLYVLRLNAKAWRGLYARVGDYSVMCRLPWEHGKRATVAKTNASAML